MSNIIGEKFGWITVVSLKERKRYGSIYHCVCECGNETSVFRGNLISGKSRSCGCKRLSATAEKNTTHGETKEKHGGPSKEYRAWGGIKTRCFNKKSHAYNRYGGRGITMCDSWADSFESFLEDMGRAPSKEHSIDRIDNSKGYYPENCRWATYHEQNSNTRRTRLSEEMVEKIRSGELDINEVINETGCCEATYSHAKTGRNWR